MAIERRDRLLALAAVLAIVSFGAGYAARSAGRVDLVIYTGNGYVGADQATFQAGETSFGFESSVAWTDRTGTEHTSGWPDCLPKLQAVTGIRFGAAMVWHESIGFEQVLWVDCRI